LAVDAGVDAVGYGFDFGEFGHLIFEYRRKVSGGFLVTGGI
jgi:hypothetical protein